MRYNLAIAGGGAKGFAHAGALKELEIQGHDFNRLVGTSAGAITAVLLAAGYNADEIQATFTEKGPDGQAILATFPDIPESFDDEIIARSVTAAMVRDMLPGFLGGETGQHINENVTTTLLKSSAYRAIFSFVELGGLYAGEVFLNWITEKLNADGRNLGGATLAQFNEQTGCDLTMVATDTLNATPVVMNHRTTPQVPVAWAVRMSMSIPLAYQEVIWQADWGQYNGSDITGHTIVDGGIVSTLPLELLLSHEPEVLDVMGGIPRPSSVIGLLLDIAMSVPGADQFPPKEVDGVGERIQASDYWARISTRITNLINTMTKSHDNIMVSTHPECVCRLPAQGYTAMEFDMSDERIQLLVDAGRAAMREHLEQRYQARPGVTNDERRVTSDGGRVTGDGSRGDGG